MKRITSQALNLVLAAVLGWLFLTGCTKQAKMGRHLKRAEQYYQKHDYAKAEIEFRNVLRYDGSNVQAIGRLGLIFLEFGQLPQAYQVLMRASKLDPTNLEVRLKYGQVCMSARQHPVARNEALYILGKNPKYPDAALLLGDSSGTKEEQQDAASRIAGFLKSAGETAEFHLALGTLALRRSDTNSADVSFKRAQALDPNAPGVLLGLASMAIVHGDMKLADTLFKKSFEQSGPYSPRKLRYIDFKLSTGAIAEAKTLLEQLTKEAPDFLPALSYVAKINYAEQKLDEGVKINERILTKDPANFEALLMNSKISLIKGDKDKALKEALRMQSLYPKAPQVQFQLAVAHLSNNDSEKAVALLTDAVTSEPTYAEAVMLLSELRIRRGEYNPAIAGLTQLLKVRPEVLQAHFVLASAYMARQTPEDAIAVYQNIMRAVPNNPQAPYLLGMLHRQRNKPAEARPLLEKAVSLAPEMIGPLEALIALDLEQGKAAAAQARLKPLMEKAPKASALRFLYGKTLEAQTNLAGAEAEFKKILETDQDYRPAVMELAEMYIRTKRTDEAIQKLEAATTKRTNDVVAWIQLGMLHGAANRPAKAQAAYEKVVALSPRNFLALNNLANIYLDSPGQLDKALEVARKAKEASPNSPYGTDTLGWVLFKKGDYAAALPLFQEAAKLLEQDSEIQYHLGLAHYMLGEEGPARIALGKAVAGKKAFDGREDAAKRLAVLSLDASSGDPKVLSELEKTLDSQPSDLISAQKLGSAYEKAGKLDKAVTVYEKALKANPKATVLAIKLVSLNADKLGKLARAIEIARASREASPGDPQAGVIFARAALRSNKGEDHQWALSLLLDASSKLARQPEAFHDLAVTQFYTGGIQEAELTMRNALVSAGSAGYPRIEEARRFLSFVEAVRDPSIASKHAALAQDQLNKDPENVPALIVAASIYSQKGQASVAVQALEKALARAPLCSAAMAPLAQLLMEQPVSEAKGLELGLKARASLPDDMLLARSLGAALYRKGDIAQSVQLLKVVTSRRTSDADAFYLLGMGYAKSNQKREGRDALQKALQLDGKHKLAAEARKLVAELGK